MKVTPPLACCILTLLAPLSGAAAQCEPVWSGLGDGASWEVRALASFDEDGSGPKLFAAGGFATFAGLTAPMLARWDGWSASTVGGRLVASDYGAASLLAVEEWSGNVAPGLYVGGEMDEAGGLPINNLARWADGEWSDVGGGVTPPGISIPYVFAMQLFDPDGAGPMSADLIVGGIFEEAGGVKANGIARWDGTSFHALGDGLGTEHPGSTVPSVKAMAVFDDGRGPALYVGGSFSRAGGERAHNIARWDGERWEDVGIGVSGLVESICVFDEDGPGPKRPALFVGGNFNWAAPELRVGGLARWDGSEWSNVGGWDVGAALAMIVWDENGSGLGRDSLYIGGKFHRLPFPQHLTPANQLARWDGERWHAVGGGVTGFGTGTKVSALAVFDEDGPGPNPGGLYVGGSFSEADGVPAKNIARWGCPLPASKPCYADCDGDGELTFFDFLCFQNLFAAEDPTADCDQSGALDFFDFLCFQNAFIAGCQ